MEKIAYLGAWAPVIYGLGLLGWVLFYGRFYVQWIASEIQGKSVFPLSFWYLSASGSILLFTYGVFAHSRIGTLSHCFNLVIYARNLTHVWREAGALSRRRSIGAHGIAGVVVLLAMVMLGYTWGRGAEAMEKRAWIWIGVGVLGQGLFALRFLIQWLVTEWKRRSVVPVSFWPLSIAATLLLCASHAQQREWIYAAGLAATLPVYVRNLWLIGRASAPCSEEV